MAVKEFDGRVLFLRKVVPGAADRSYGIQVAELAGLPAEVTAPRARGPGEPREAGARRPGRAGPRAAAGRERGQRPVPPLLRGGGARAREAAGGRRRSVDAGVGAGPPGDPAGSPQGREGKTGRVTSGLFGVGIAAGACRTPSAPFSKAHPPYGVILFRRNLESVDADAGADPRAEGAGRALSLRGSGGRPGRPPRRDPRALALSPGGRPAREGARAGRARRLRPRAARASTWTWRRSWTGARRARERWCWGSGAPRPTRTRCWRRPADSWTGSTRGESEDASSTSRASVGRASTPTRPFRCWSPTRTRRRWTSRRSTRSMHTARAVMISHLGGPDGLPASLSPERSTRLLRDRLGFDGAAISDDLEMGALDAFGDLPQRCAAASQAGCDLLLVCRQIERYPECVAAVERLGSGGAPRRRRRRDSRSTRPTSPRCAPRRRRPVPTPADDHRAAEGVWAPRSS